MSRNSGKLFAVGSRGDSGQKIDFRYDISMENSIGVLYKNMFYDSFSVAKQLEENTESEIIYVDTEKDFIMNTRRVITAYKETVFLFNLVSRSYK